MNAQQLKNSILQEAIEGRLVPQDPNDEPASVLLDKIREEKRRLVKKGILKKKDLEEIPVDEESIPFEIPNSWVWVRFGTITINRDRERIPLSVAERSKLEKKYDYYGASGVIDKVDRYLFNKPLLLIGEDGANLINRSTPIAFIARGEYWVNNHAHVLDYLNEELMQYVCWYINAISLVDYVTGTAQPKMNQEKMNSILVALPPLAEQRRIVERIEEILPFVKEYGEAYEEASKMDAELPEKLKKSILQEAIMGKLGTQDDNDEPASVLLEKIREEKKRLVKEGKLKKKDLEEIPISEDEKPFEIPESWEWCKLGTIAALIGGFAFKSHEYTSSGSRVIRISDITENGFINKNVVRFPFTDKLSQYVILEGDILMAMTGGTVGKSLYVKYLPEETMLLNQRVALIRPNIVFTDYIDYVIKSQHIQGIITEAKNSTNDNISMGDLYNFPIPLPPLAEQKRIVAKIEQLMKEIDKLKV